MLDTLGHRAKASGKIGGYVLALAANGFDDEIPISAIVLRLAVTRLLKTASKRAPLPAKLLEECRSAREKVEWLLQRTQHAESRCADLRMALQWRINTRGNTTDDADKLIPY
jgi:hypothetical protein